MSDMDIKRLSAKQKRIMDWESARAGSEVDPELTLQFKELLKEYRNLLAKCWQEEHFTEPEIAEIENLEARIDQIHEESRLASRH